MRFQQFTEQIGKFGYSSQYGYSDAAAPRVHRVNDEFFLLVFNFIRIQK